MARTSLSEISAEVRLLGALCRPRNCAFAGASSLEQFVSQVGDWPLLVKLLRHHRVVPLAARNLEFMRSERLPLYVKTELHAWAGANAREAFRYVSVLQELLAILTKENIAALVLKGVPLSLLAYGDVSARDVGDIDLLVEDRDALRADALLREAGFNRKEPAARLTRKRASFCLRNFKDFTYEATAGGFEVDLHWRLIRDSQTAGAILSGSLRAASQDLRIGTMDLRVLSIERTVLFLAAHGALEGWARWKTLADIAALWSSASAATRADTWNFASESSTTGFLAAALVLAADWFHASPYDDVTAQLSKSKGPQRRIFAHILEQSRSRMQHESFMASPSGPSTFAMKSLEARLHPSAKSRFELAKRILFRPRIWEAVDLPDSLFAFYPLLSPIEWVSFRRKKSPVESVGH